METRPHPHVHWVSGLLDTPTPTRQTRQQERTRVHGLSQKQILPLTRRESIWCCYTHRSRISSYRSLHVSTAVFVMKNKRKRAEPVIELVDEAEEVAELEQQVVATAPARGTQPFTESSGNRQPFTALPLSQRTTRGLDAGGFKTMTEIQVRLGWQCLNS